MHSPRWSPFGVERAAHRLRQPTAVAATGEGSMAEPQRTARERWSPRYFRDGDEAGILELFQRSFRRWPPHEVDVDPLDHLRWKVSSDDTIRHSMLLTEHRRRIISASLRIAMRAKVRDEIRAVVQGTDAAVLPEYQSQGVSDAVTRFRIAQRNTQSDLLFNIVSGHAALAKLRQMPTSRRIVWPVDILFREPRESRPTRPADGYAVREVRQFDDRVDAFWPEALRQFDFAIVRSSEFLNWRYCDRRAGQFTVLQAEDADRLLGYVVFRPSYGRGYVADLIALPDRLDVVAALLTRAIAALETRGVHHIECWCVPKHAYAKVLHRHGFRHRKRTVRVSLRAQKPDDTLSPVDEPGARWHITSGDTDLV